MRNRNQISICNISFQIPIKYQRLRHWYWRRCAGTRQFWTQTKSPPSGWQMFSNYHTEAFSPVFDYYKTVIRTSSPILKYVIVYEGHNRLFNSTLSYRISDPLTLTIYSDKYSILENLSFWINLSIFQETSELFLNNSFFLSTFRNQYIISYTE